MANINLISARRAERVRLSRIARGVMVAIVGTVGAGVIGAAVFAAQILSVKVQIGGADRELARLSPIRKEIEAADKERLVLKPKMDTLNEARVRTRRWWDILEGLKRAVPEQTWLTSLGVETRNEGSQALRLTGTTVSQERVGETMLRLTQQVDYYSKVDLRFTQATNGDYGDTVEFELSSDLQPFEAAKPKEEGSDAEAKAN